MFSFVKYQGAGNDFILIDDRSRSFSFYSQIQEICHRKWGIGADGLILLQKDPVADFKMRIFNSDGSEAMSCGNGLRCLALFLVDLGLPKGVYRVAVGSRIVEVGWKGDLVSVDMGIPEKLELHLSTEQGLVHFIDTGVPHVVQFVSDVEGVDLSFLGPYFRHYPRFAPEGANVNVASRVGVDTLLARTFERGVGETLACGTGAVAIAFLAHKIYGLAMPLKICFRGGDLIVDEKGGGVSMAGPARKIYQGFCSLPGF